MGVQLIYDAIKPAEWDNLREHDKEDLAKRFALSSEEASELFNKIQRDEPQTRYFRPCLDAPEVCATCQHDIMEHGSRGFCP